VDVLAGLALAAAVALGGPAAADRQTILHLLDHVGVDYAEVVADAVAFTLARRPRATA
jgi:hypothetical protein